MNREEKMRELCPKRNDFENYFVTGIIKTLKGTKIPLKQKYRPQKKTISHGQEELAADHVQQLRTIFWGSGWLEPQYQRNKWHWRRTQKQLNFSFSNWSGVFRNPLRFPFTTVATKSSGTKKKGGLRIHFVLIEDKNGTGSIPELNKRITEQNEKATIGPFDIQPSRKNIKKQQSATKKWNTQYHVPELCSTINR